MQRASDAVAALAILVGAAGSLAFTSLVLENRSSEFVVEGRAPNAPAQLDGILRIPLPPVDHREIRVRPGKLHVMHVPTVLSGAVVAGTSDARGGVIIEFDEAVAPGVLIEGEDQTRAGKRHKRQEREERKKRRRRDGR